MNASRSTTLTFLFTDIEGSTRLWEQHPAEMQSALGRHDALLRESIEAGGGQVVKNTGDGLYAIFGSAADGVAAALNVQQALIGETWPEATGKLSVRMGLHTGEAQRQDGDYFGQALNRTSRLMSSGHGGQILISGVTEALVRDALPPQVYLLDLGEHTLRDLSSPEHVFQVCHPELRVEFPAIKSMAVYKHNLPVQLTSFVGRERELAEVKRLMGETRLLTLLGPGGTGKTRLMLQAAADLIEHYPDGVWLVELAALDDPDLIVERLAAVFDVQEQPGRDLLDVLSDHLRGRQLLLLLDNVEHLVSESAAVAEHLLMHCPKIKILVTGRESLFIGGEVTLQIPSLSLPDRKGEVTLEKARDSEAVQLFLERARAVQPGFQLSTENAPAVVEIVRRLDGIPLALELAAARMRMLSVEQIAERLNDRFRLLTGGRRTALPRQQTLQALIDWSWNLLSEDERLLFRRLSVFSGGWILEAAEAVVGVDGLDVMLGLEDLVNKCLVVADHLAEGGVRYRMLESIRQYARDRLFEAGEGMSIRDQHAEYMTALIEQAVPHLRGRDMLPWLERLMAEADNFRAAREWSLESRLDLSLRMAGTLGITFRYWTGLLETRRWLEAVIEKSLTMDPAELDSQERRNLASAVVALGMILVALGESKAAMVTAKKGVALARESGATRALAFGLNVVLLSSLLHGEIEAAEPIAEEAITISRQHGYDAELVMALGSFTPVFEFQGDHEQAQASTEESIRLSRRSGNPFMNAMAFHLQARLEVFRGNLDEARACFAKAADLFEAVRDRGFVLICRSEIAHILRQQGDLTGAETVYRETISSFYESGHLPGVAHQLECFAYIAVGRGRYERAARLLGQARELRERLDAESSVPSEQVELAQAIEKLGEELGESKRGVELDMGRKMSVNEAIAYARGDG